jgi:hypothetical protein
MMLEFAADMRCAITALRFEDFPVEMKEAWERRKQANDSVHRKN